jgi:hypothetical protein
MICRELKCDTPKKILLFLGKKYGFYGEKNGYGPYVCSANMLAYATFLI